MARAKLVIEERSLRWTELVLKWRDSGASQASFCREHGLNPNSFNFWKLRVLRQRPGARRKRRILEAPEASGLPFIPVQVATPVASAIEVGLHSGHTIRITPGFDEATLRRLVGVLEQRGAC